MWTSGPRTATPQITGEFARIMAIPRRFWGPADEATISDRMTGLLKTPGGTMSLFPIQAVALLEIAEAQGGFLPIRVAGGKTLISLLAPTVLGAERPMLLVPAKLVEKTRRSWRILAQHWRIHPMIRIESYELMGRSQAAQILDTYRPDVLVADEAHKLKSSKAACTRRVRRYLEANPGTRYVDMSGTVTKRSLKDYAHRVKWALRGSGCPVPLTYQDLEAWAGVLDERAGAWRGAADPDPGALAALCAVGETPRQGFRRRLVDTLGVVATEESALGIPTIGEISRPHVPTAVADAIATMRAKWETPAGEPFADAMTMWRHVRELGLGFWYLWDPAAPVAWLEARRTWAAWSRHIIEHGRRNLDSEAQVAQAVDLGHYPEAARALADWRAIRPTFEPRHRPEWVSDFALDWARQEMTKPGAPALVWTHHTAFAERLSELSHVPYFGRLGQDKHGRSIMDHDPREPAICSIRSVGEGFDLQAWSRHVVVSCPTNGPEWEQLLGRCERPGQTAEEISLIVLSTCAEHDNALSQAQADAAYIQDTTGQHQKLLGVDWV